MIADFELIYIDQLEYDSLLIQIEYKGQIVCRVDKENGNDAMQIHLFPDLYIEKEKETIKCPLDEFLEVISFAKEQLAMCP